MFYSVSFFRTFSVVKSIESAYEIARDSANASESRAVFFFSASFRTGIAYHAAVSAYGVAVYGVVH